MEGSTKYIIYAFNRPKKTKRINERVSAPFFPRGAAKRSFGSRAKCPVPRAAKNGTHPKKGCVAPHGTAQRDGKIKEVGKNRIDYVKTSD